MDMWHNKEYFNSAEDRRTQLRRFLNFYNTVKPHKGIDNLTPYEKVEIYFNNCKQPNEI
jgi:transposase InsO family protein